MKYNPAIIRSAKEEWTDWLEAPEGCRRFTLQDKLKWFDDRPPLSAFSNMADTIDLMQDEIDLLNMQLQEAMEELVTARRQLTKRM